MMVLRPVAGNDLEALYRLAEQAGAGMTNLPAERSVLAEKIAASEAAFARVIDPDEDPGEEAYLFILEDTTAHRVVGCCGVFAAVGLQRPCYSFRRLDIPHTSSDLGVYHSHQALQLVNEYSGAAEVGVLFLEPDYRRDGNGKLLSRARFLFMAEFRHRFPERVMAELRGLLTSDGESVFWDYLTSHFIPLSFVEADTLSAHGNTQFIADLLPKQPIYINLLPEAVQQAIGVAHEASRPALRMLEREGFRAEGCVDVFDAGPTIHCPIDEVRTVRDSRRAVVSDTSKENGTVDALICTHQLRDLRICRVRLGVTDDTISLASDTATALGVTVGDSIRYVEF